MRNLDPKLSTLRHLVARRPYSRRRNSRDALRSQHGARRTFAMRVERRRPRGIWNYGYAPELFTKTKVFLSEFER